jgi:hypothetical protein
MDIVSFIFAIIFLIVGHAIRVKRWNNILPGNDNSLRSVQFASLSIGYVINFFIPLKVGEVVRAASYSFLGKKSFATSLASVVFERLIDIIVWSVFIGIIVWFYVDDKELFLSENYTGLVLAALGFSVFYNITKSNTLRKKLNKISSIFNDDISFSLRHFLWTVGETYDRFRNCWVQFLINTFLMWGTYVFSYYLLANSIKAPISLIVSSLFNKPLNSTISLIVNSASMGNAILISFFFLSPVVFIFLYHLVKNKYSYQPEKIITWFSSSTLGLPDKRDLFATKEQYQFFLLRSFRSEVDIISEFYQFGMKDGAILHRIFHGGSDALTTLVSHDGSLAVRKFASTRGREKLRAQKQWLQNNKNRLPLAAVSGEYDKDGIYTYDMPYSTSSIDFYEYIHSADIETSWNYLEQVINRISEFHSDTSGELASEEIINRYLDKKLKKNFLDIKSLAPLFFESESIVINGVDIDVKRIESWLLCNDFAKHFQYTGTGSIHGDLTIENIIIDKEADLGWFIIDPNVGNLFESPLIDFAKLMQSLHLGYESLNRSIQCQIDGGNIDVSFYRTSQYSQLSTRYNNWLKGKYSEQYLKEVLLHEIIHYMRLVPYKFRKDVNIGMAFTACMLLLVDKFIKEYT